MTKRLERRACEICGRATVAWFHPKTSVRYDVCPSCDHIRRDPSLDPTPGEEKSQYDLHENSPDNEGYVRFLKRFADCSLHPFLPEGRVLDLGSGPAPVFTEILGSEYGDTALLLALLLSLGVHIALLSVSPLAQHSQGNTGTATGAAAGPLRLRLARGRNRIQEPAEIKHWPKPGRLCKKPARPGKEKREM